jgi:Ca2+-binding RTX toxin-like protein
MTRGIGLTTTIAAIAVLTLGLLTLASADARANSASVTITGGNTLKVVDDDTGNDLYENVETDPACPGGSPCFAVRSGSSVLVPSAPCILGVGGPFTHEALCPASGITGLVEFGNGGDDRFYGDLGVPADIHGGAGKDAIEGGSANDTLVGGAGNDKLRGLHGDDLLKGNAGNDGMDGGRGGHDRCIGGSGRDTPRNCERVRSVP